MGWLPEPDLQHFETLVRRVGVNEACLSVRAMPGGASTRSFYRVDLGDGRSAVAMFVPDAGRPDEIAKVSESGRRWPFLEVLELLTARGIRVPRLLAEACEHGLILVEDLGDDTLAAYLERRPDRRESLYRSAVVDLARAQRALSPLPAGCIVTERGFDFDLLRWELDHFREYGLEARGVHLGAADRALFDAAADHVARTIAAFSRRFVHRDYQSRNLMVVDDCGVEALAWVDFQDALLGPRAYDLVALLSDSYQQFDYAFVSARLDEYAAELGLDAADRERLGREFDWITVQRKLKDAGRFVYIEHKKGDASYLRFVQPTLQKVFAALDRLSEDPLLASLRALLGRVTAPLDS